MAHHFFDMDHTLIDNDCDVSWKAFLIENGRADAAQRAEVERFYTAYERNELDERSFLAFQLAEFVGQGQATMRQLAEEHFEAKVRPSLFPKAWTLLADIVARGDQIHLLTATNKVVASPVAEYLTIPDVIATELEIDNNVYTGQIVDIYCFGPGKLERLQRRCSELEIELRDVYYYGDSVSDVVVLEAVGHPVATNPMPAVRALAQRKNWPVLDF